MIEKLPLIVYGGKSMIHGFPGSYGPGFMFMGMIFWILVIVGVIYLIIWLVNQNKTSAGNRNQNIDSDSSMEILKQRYAKGEITDDEFEEKKKKLEN
jgi:putative membrane protein